MFNFFLIQKVPDFHNFPASSGLGALCQKLVCQIQFEFIIDDLASVKRDPMTPYVNSLGHRSEYI